MFIKAYKYPLGFLRILLVLNIQFNFKLDFFNFTDQKSFCFKNKTQDKKLLIFFEINRTKILYKS
jgi:hypothetical protein